MQGQDIRKNNVIFSLDIGTRNVVGTLAVMDADNYAVLDHEMIPHPERAMYDGQIHDIDKVAQVVETIRTRLEERTGKSLKQVAIAAAGRALRTRSVRLRRELDYTREIDKGLMDSVEMEGIQQAQSELAQEDPTVENRYYCVGYSVVNYYLDGAMISNPRGHKGALLEAELISTFLPHIVVDSLYTVMERVGLEVISLTLEPIAAINVAIPNHLRLLNLALVDVGAGTSDIAITRDGSVVSYGMVAMAGDRITEALAKDYLLDFRSAEQLKVDLMTNEEVSFTDVVGIPQALPRTAVLERIDPIIDKITGEIARQIVEVNDQPPSAVFCIGGGCQVPGFTDKLAGSIGLPPERVVIKGTEMLEKVTFETTPLMGPENITPVGIGYSAFTEREHDFLQVTVNEKPIRLFNSKQLSVSDALILVGYNARKLLAERGPSLELTIDGKKRTLMGDYGEPARIFVNGIVSSLDSKIHNKDVIYVDPAVPGTPRQATVADVLPVDKHVCINDVETPLISQIRVNGQMRDRDHILSGGDVIETERLERVADAVRLAGFQPEQVRVHVNDTPAAEEQSLSEGAIVRIEALKAKPEMADPNKVVDMPTRSDADVTVSDTVLEPVAGASSPADVLAEDLDDRQAEYDTAKSLEGAVSAASEKPDPGQVREYYFLVNGKQVHVNDITRAMVFVDIFEYIDFDISKPQGILDLKLNGERARYTDMLKTGDVIDIKWR